MGAWGHRPFENDAAMDWLQDSEGELLAGIRSALAFTADCAADEYLDVDDGSGAMAAAKLVAVVLTGDFSGVPAIVREQLLAEEPDIEERDAQLAVRAVMRVLEANSELASLWGESEWRTEAERLIKSLQ